MWNLAIDPRSLPFNYSTEGSQIGVCLAVPWKVCQTQMAGPRVPDLADFMSSEFLFQTSLMLLLKGPQRPQFKNFCPMPKGLSHRGWNRGRKEITMTVASKKKEKNLEESWHGIKEERSKTSSNCGQAKIVCILGPFASLVGKQFSWDFEQPKTALSTIYI